MRFLVVALIFIVGCESSPKHIECGMEHNNTWLLNVGVDDLVVIRLRVHEPYYWRHKFENGMGVAVAPFHRTIPDNWVKGDAVYDEAVVHLLKYSHGYIFNADMMNREGEVQQTYKLIICPRQR